MARKKRTITQTELANILGVSTMTVSKALREHPDISTEMQERVKTLARETGYRPNLVARNLSSKRTNTVGVVLPRINHSFYSNAMSGIYGAAHKKNYHVILTPSQENSDTELENINTLLSLRVDGLLISIAQNSKREELTALIDDSEIPVVFFDRVLKREIYNSVQMDNCEGARHIVEHAINLGYTKIGHLAGLSSVDLSLDRKQGYLDALTDHGLEINDQWILECGFGYQAGYEGFYQLFDRGDLPEVVFCVSDSVAIGVYKAARELYLSIPQDIGVLGFSDIDVADAVSPGLTTVHEPSRLIGVQALNLLLNEFENGEKPEKDHIIVNPELVIRESCGEQLSNRKK